MYVLPKNHFFVRIFRLFLFLFYFVDIIKCIQIADNTQILMIAPLSHKKKVWLVTLFDLHYLFQVFSSCPFALSIYLSDSNKIEQ